MHSSCWYLLTNFCTSSPLSGDYIDVNSNQSSTIYDSRKTMKSEGGILYVCVCVCVCVCVVFLGWGG